ncbi:hypothetical protein CMUS01_11844 [Colletotrichum musicola]|uniref:Uncharacterized protein n=1 Tax=Colletotrichum musicola TaxID=2175873 RepID=A0A8H6JSX7_9PEZI|nr:hypothetical protein CMUS01_11844 [Colletotrichum musicola]
MAEEEIRRPRAPESGIDTEFDEDSGIIHDLPESDTYADVEPEAMEVMEMLGVDEQDGIVVDGVDANILAAQPHDFARYLSRINVLLAA